MNKKGNFENWPEQYFWVLLFLGFFISLISNVVISYIVIFLCGLIAGRLFYLKRKGIKFFLTILVAGFIIGYLMGSLHANRFLLLIIFLAANYLSFSLHKKKIL